MQQFGMGRRPSPLDLRDRSYPIRRIGQVVAPKPRLRFYREGPVLNQGDKPWCVGASARGLLNAAPFMVHPDMGPSMRALYFEAQDHDEWDGNNYDGSSVRGGMKALQTLGYIKSYLWGDPQNPALAVAEARSFMMNGHGTVIVGTNWYLPMFDVDSKGYMQAPTSTDTPVGGHAWRINWWDQKMQAFLAVNTWGNDWGLKGRAFIKEDLLVRLIGEDGEIAAPTEVKFK